ncbi:MAG: peptidoglycan editing factor PgeF [Mycoplasmatales bacterium]
MGFNLDNNNFVFKNDNIKIILSSNKGGVSKIDNGNNNMSFNIQQQGVAENRIIFANRAEIPLKRSVFANQTHSTNFYEVKAKDCGKGLNSHEDGIDNVDCLYTFEKNIPLFTFHADCVPVYFYSEEDNLIGIIHAGWQGSVNIITKRVLAHILELGIDPNNIKVVIGPSISMKCFECQDDVIDKIKEIPIEGVEKTYKQYKDRYKADMKLLNKLQVLDLGIPEENIHMSDICTFKNKHLFSYRKNNDTGRMVACIYQS